MQQETFIVNAEPRSMQGTGASRRLRRTGRIPAIVYGGSSEPTMVSVDHNELWKHLKHEAFYSHILTLNLAGASEQVVLKDLHRHPVREEVMHADFLRVQSDVAIRMRVPLHFLGQDVAPGVKTGGGVMDHQMNEVEVECLPKDLPEFIEVDVSGLNLGESVHLSQLTVPKGVTVMELKHGNDPAVIVLQQPRVGADEAAAPGVDAGEEQK